MLKYQKVYNSIKKFYKQEPLVYRKACKGTKNNTSYSDNNVYVTLLHAMYHDQLQVHIKCFHMTSWRPYWCTKNNEMAAIHLAFQDNPTGIELFSFINAFLTLKLLEVAKVKIIKKQISFFEILKHKMVPHESTAEEVSFEWSTP